MIRRPIPSTGELVPIIGLGTWQTFDVGEKPTELHELTRVVRALADLGGAMIDSSPMYGRAEEVVGSIVGQLDVRASLFLATKVWTTGREQGIREMERSMTRMRARPIDLMQVHNLVDVATHLATLHDWKRGGTVRYIGVTHYTASAHADVAKLIERETVDFLQINYSVAEREAERRLLPIARDRGIAVIANRPFATGELLSRVSRKPIPPWAAEVECATWSQLLLKFVVSHPALTCASPATSSVAHVVDNIAAGDGPMPDDALREKIARAALSS